MSVLKTKYQELQGAGLEGCACGDGGHASLYYSIFYAGVDHINANI